MKIKALAVYCGTQTGITNEYVEAATAFGELTAKKGITLVYGGGSVGLMGAVANGALQANGRVIGVMPNAIVDLEIAHSGLSEFRIVDTMHTRKKTIADLVDGFVALPGGFGTLEEILEMVTWRQLGLHPKPCGLLNVCGFFNGLIVFLEHMVGQGFLPRRELDRLVIEESADELFRRIESQCGQEPCG